MDYIFGTEIEPLPLLLTAKTAIHWGMFGLRSTITSKSAHKMQEKKLWQMARTWTGPENRTRLQESCSGTRALNIVNKAISA